MKVVYSARIDADILKEWKLYITASGMDAGETLEKALEEHMNRHELAGNKKQLFDLLKRRQKCCTLCEHVEVNEMTDERYCMAKDGEQIRLRWHKHRPDWCPLVERDRKAQELLGAIGKPAMLELLAEECAELGHAVLKLARKYRGENPTPRTRADCLIGLEEELADVLIVIDQLDGIVGMEAVAEHKKEKLRRWKERVNLTSQ